MEMKTAAALVEREGRGQRALPVSDPSAVAEVRRRAVQAAERLGFDEVRRGTVAIVATEAATNLVKHAKGGEIVIREVRTEATWAVEILALDRGPGMDRLAESQRDGYSSAGTAGNGLGAIRRLASRFDIATTPGVGTVLLAEIAAVSAPARPAALDVGVVCLAYPGEHVCGDGWATQARPEGLSVIVVDGLGHGADAARAADEALAFFRRETSYPPGRLLEIMHPALRHTRGVAVAVAEVDVALGLVRFAGVGNIAAAVVGPGRLKNLIALNGTVGHVMPRVAREYQEPFPDDAALVMCSDGIATRWDVSNQPGLLTRHPALLAASIYRDHARGKDDLTVLALRRPAAA
jgi:anti-sigma regulatory factor (Ser/Thr protein kinase)